MPLLPSSRLKATACICLVGQSLSCHLLSLLLSKCRTCTAFLLIRSGDAAANPYEDGACSHHPLCMGSAFFKKALATSSLLMLVGNTLTKKTLGSTLVENLLATSILLSLMSGFLVKKALAGCRLVALAVVPTQFVHGPLPGLVGLFCAGTTPGKNLPSPVAAVAEAPRPGGLCARRNPTNCHWDGRKRTIHCTPSRGCTGEVGTI
jgi:hypothetical protein